MAFLIRNTTGTAVPLDDLGLEVPSNGTYDLTSESPFDVAISSDLANAITAGDIVVLDPRLTSPVYPADAMSPTDSQLIVDSHNDSHFGIRGANINDLDDVDTTSANTGDVLQLTGGIFTVTPPSSIASNINLGDLADVVDGNTLKPIQDFYILIGDGANGAVLTNAITDNTVFIPFIEDITGNVFTGGAYGDLTFTYNTATNKVDAAVNDSYLRNDGDTLDSGTLNIISGASLVIGTGATATIVDVPLNPNDITNKAYVDSLAQGADVKDAAHFATTISTGDLGGLYTDQPGTTPDTITGINFLIIDGITATLGDRLVVKNQTDPQQNGIYVVTSVSTVPDNLDLQRAPDHDGDPANEVSAGNLVFVEQGTINGNTSWIVTGSGDLVLNTDPINWTQFSAAATITAGPGLGIDGSQFYIDVGNLTSITVTASDEIVFNDVSDAAIKNDKKRTFGDVISDLGILTNSSLTASDGILITGGDIQLDITNLPSLTTPTLNAEMVFDAGATGIHNKGTVADFFNGLDVVHGITNDGFLVRTANDTYASRVITPSTIPGEEGVIITGGDGIAGNPQVGVDITGSAASTSNMAGTDNLLLFNGTNNVKVTGNQLAAGVSSILGGLGSAYTIITGDTGIANASSSTDTLHFTGLVGGGIITTVIESSPDTVSYGIDFNQLTPRPTAVTSTMLLGIGEGVASPTTSRPLGNVLSDLGVPMGLGSLTGIVVSNGIGGYSTTSIAVEGIGAFNGLSIINQTGVAAAPTIGFDINGTAAAGESISAADEIVAYNASNTANEKYTGQELADGVATIIGLSNINVSTINGQPVLTLIDTTRTNKVLSVSEVEIVWAENRLNDNDWVAIGAARDARSGYIAPMNGTIVRISAHTSNDNSNIKPINLYIDGSLSGPLGTFTGTGGEGQFIDPTLNVDFIQGAKLRLRAGGGGVIEDTVISVFVKWRA